MFNLTALEANRINEARAAAELLFGKDCVASMSYIFTPTGIANSVKIRMVLNTGVVIEKDVSDMDSW